MLAPIALFVYARPAHTRKAVEALQGNALAAESDLFIFSDAAKTAQAAPAVREVRAYIRGITGFRSVTLIERETNFGLSASIIDGVTRLSNDYGRVIVVEDDVVAAPGFLRFMNQALDAYEGEEKVMHVSGYMFPVAGAEALPSTFFFRAPSCWGWGTWKRAWDLFEPDSRRLLREIKSRNAGHEFDLRGAAGYVKMLRRQAAGRIDSWAVRWYGSIFLHGGLCLHPARSLSQNIGLDGTGEHCGPYDMYAVAPADAVPEISRDQEINESPQALEAIRQFNFSLRRPLHVRAVTGTLWRLRKLLRLPLR